MEADDLLFISDIYLRKKIVNAIGTISGLYLVERDEKYPPELSKEIRRTIVLYAASIIEALLLFLYKKCGKQQFKVNYNNVYSLPSSLQISTQYKLIVAKQVKIPKEERELTLDVLLKFYTNEEKIISKELAAKIEKAKDIRNTFHLSKPRSRLVANVNTIKLSAEAIYETIVVVKENLIKKKE